MKIIYHEDDFDVNEDTADTSETKDKSKADKLDKYNEGMARDAVSSLLEEDDEDDIPDDEPVVTGFDRPASKSAPRVSVRPPRSERGYGGSRSDSALSGPRVQDVLDGEEAPPRKRDRSREPNPVPRPAVRYAPPPPRERRAVRSAPVREADYDDDESNVEEEMDAFRKRYRSSPSEGARKREDTPPPPPRERKTPVRSFRLPYDNTEEADEDEAISPARWLVVAVAFILLGITAFLAVRVGDLSNQLAAAQAAQTGSPDSMAYTEMQVSLEQMTAQLTDRDNTIARLQGIIDGGAPAPDGDAPAFGLDDTPEVGVSAPEVPAETAPEQPAGEQTYTAVSGDNLSKIAQRFYGSSKPDVIQKIKDANNMQNDNVGIGQVFSLPPL